MSKNPNQPHTNDAVLGGKSSSTSLSECPVCKTECDQGKANRCSVCNWDLTPCPEAFVEKHNAQLAWAREMWINLQAQEKQLHASQSQLEEVKQDKARFEGEVLHRLEQLEQAQDKSEPVIWAQMPQDTSKVDELEKQLSRIKEQLKGSEQKRQELKSEVEQLSAQVAKFEAELQKKRADEPQLISEAGIDYSRLQNFLAAGEWGKANNETRIILETLPWLVTGDCNSSIDNQGIQQIPAPDIQTIDNLWLHYSYGRFGFSIQKRIYKEVDENLVELGKNVGWVQSGVDDVEFWRSYSKLGYSEHGKLCRYDLSFQLDTFIGHLPMPDWWWYYDYYKWEKWQEGDDMQDQNIVYIFSKLPELGIEQA
jgi:archaellum component FlaC